MITPESPSSPPAGKSIGISGAKSGNTLWREEVEVDRERIVRLIGEVERALNVLKEYQTVEKQDFTGDLTTLGSAKYYLMVAAEACIDICNHIVAKERIGVPESCADCFRLLANKRTIPHERSEKLVRMAKFRNLLVHLYGRVDNARVYDLIRSELDDFYRFIHHIARTYL
jgi:uncharacterized protein YutE (UPF0331/DUF86 family)